MTEPQSQRFSVLLVGVGGQGVLTAAKVLGDAAHAAGMAVMVGQLHGMAQRGGSVECSVIIGPGEGSHLAIADVVVGFEQLEVLRARHRMSPDTRVLLNSGRIVPYSVSQDGRAYPSLEEVVADLREVTERVVVVDGPEATRAVGVARTLNVFVLAALAGLGGLPFDTDTLWAAIERRCGERFLAPNRQAFELGIQAVGDGDG